MQPTYILEKCISLKIATRNQMKEPHNVDNKRGRKYTKMIVW